MTATTTAAPAAAASTGTAQTHVTQQPTTGYQPTNPTAPAAAQQTDQATGSTSTASTTSSPVSPPAVETKQGEEGKEPAKQQPTVETTTTAPEFKLPDEHKDKPWAAKVKSQDDLYKQIDNLTALAGKKTVVPNLKDATPEEREAFYSQLRGKDAAEYVIPENPAFPTPAETQPVVAKLFMDNGVSPTQAEAIIKGYQELGAKQLAAQFDPEGMKASMTTAFGNDWEKVTGAVRSTIKGMMNEQDFKALDAIPNNILGVVYRTLGNTINAVNGTLKKYGATETFAHLTAPNGQVAATDLNSQRTALRDQLNALSMRPHTAMEQQAIIDKLNETYKADPRIVQGQ